MEVDFIIVGQGLAGTLLAYELHSLGKSIMVYDDPHSRGASTIAAGLINPVVFRRMTKSLLTDKAFPQMEITYPALEAMLGLKFYHPTPILKILNEESVRIWKEKVRENQLEPYVEAEPDLSFRHQNIRSPFGVGRVLKAGRLGIHALVSAYKALLDHQGYLRREAFHFEMVEEKSASVRYKDITAQKIIFCEGPSASRNPYFNDLIFKHSKGEILEVKIPHIKIGEIISNDIFIIPQGHHHYKIGATYQWDDLGPETTIHAREELLAKLGRSISDPIRIISQQAGVRPTMHDRKPVAGFLPQHPTIGILNGLGSRGALLAPWCARQMAEYACGLLSDLSPDIHIGRYFSGK